MKIVHYLKPLWPHLLILLAFVGISFIYFSPVLEGKQLQQMDFIHAQGMSKELVDFEKTHPSEHSLWTNSMFGGMPSYQIKTGNTNNIYLELQRFFRFHLPYTTVAILFILLTGFYLMLISLRVNKWLSVAGALGFALASYNIIIIGAGHISKVYAIAYMPMVIAGILMIFRHKYFAGGVLTAIALGIQISCNHPQITFYLFMTVLIFLIFQFVYAIREKVLKKFFIASMVLGVASILALLPNIANLWITYEYGQDTIRGKSLLVKSNEKNKNGLDEDYALAWSYGKAETLTLLVPNAMGGGSNGFDANSETAKVLRNVGAQDPEHIAASLPAYWGDQPFTSGPVYFGAIMFFLFILGLFIVNGKEKWWLVAATILAVMLSWGRNLQWFTDLFFYHFPMYNKFRTVSMILIIANFTVVFLAVLALRDIISGKTDRKKLLWGLKYSSLITGGLLIILVLMPGLFFSFQGTADQTLSAQLNASGWPKDIINQLFAAMTSDREAMMRADALRSIAFIGITAALLWAYLSDKIKLKVLLPTLIALVLIDQWTIDRRYLNNDMFVKNNEAKNVFKPSAADELILKDKELDFRVLNLTRSVFNDAYTPYFHKSIGGYHGAKLRRYQDVIDSCLMPEIQMMQSGLSKISKIEDIPGIMEKQPVINMLNTKYIIVNPNIPPLQNDYRLGNAWFVKNYQIVPDANAELAATCASDPSTVAIVSTSFLSQMKSLSPADSNATDSITMVGYAPNHLIYHSNTKTNRLAVFSEIYYNKGWDASIDGHETSYMRANYILRAMIVPAGSHTIEFRFEPKSFYAGTKIALTSSILVILLVLGALGNFIYKDIKKKS